MKNKKGKLLSMLIVASILFSYISVNSINADDEIENENIEEVVVSDGEEIVAASEEITVLSAPVDWAFTEDSKPLHDAILVAYPAVDGSDGSTPDGYISIDEAGTGTVSALIVKNLNLGGTANGLEHFKNLTQLDIQGNDLTGDLPKLAGDNNPNLWNLCVTNNSFSGFIPTEWGTLTNIVYFVGNHNQISGELPASLGNWTKCTQFGLLSNNLTGSIPEEYKKMINMEIMDLGNNNLSGDVPNIFETMPKLVKVRLDGNEGLSGNPVNLFASSSLLETLCIEETGLIQAKPNQSTLTSFTYDNLSEMLLNDNKDNLSGEITQVDIDKAQESANYWSNPDKSEWQANIDLAQDMLNAKEAVNDLYNTDKSNLVSGVTVADVENAQTLVSELPTGELKTELQSLVDNANAILNAREAIDNLFDTEGTGLATGVAQQDIDNAKELANKVAPGSVQDELLAKVVEAQSMMDAKKDAEGLLNDAQDDLADGVDQNAITNAGNAVADLVNGSYKDALQSIVDKAQNILDAITAVDDLYNDDKSDLVVGVTQDMINDAQKAVDKLDPNSDKAKELQELIDDAQTILNNREVASNAVDDLFNDKKDNLGSGVTQEDVKNAQDLVNKLPDGEYKENLQKEIDTAQNMLDAKEAVGDLLDENGNLKEGITQEDIDNAQDLVNKLPEGELKDSLQSIIDEVQKQLDEKNETTSKPSTSPTSPTVDASSSVGGKSVNTSDATNVSLYLGLLAISLGGIVLVKRRKIESK